MIKLFITAHQEDIVDNTVIMRKNYVKAGYHGPSEKT